VHRKLLIDAGYSVDEASNGAEAVAMFDRGYSAIFMDITAVS
jgi:CheY-like chemotaxis protein